MDEDRLKHSLAVARKMIEIGKLYELNENELQELFILGYNHDIGYQFGVNSNHNIVGGILLRNTGYRYWKEVFYHGQVNIEYESLYLDILNMADMQIDKFGNDVGYTERLNDIKNRYGDESIQYSNARNIIEKILHI